MKFFAKDPESTLRNLVYQGPGHNDKIRDGLLAEQCGFCSYTEKKIDFDYTCAIEHFDARLKGAPNDGYENYYVVLQAENQRKRRKEKQFSGASFFTSRFFQKKGGFQERIQYVVEDHVYQAIDDTDQEAKDFIDYLGLNSEYRVKDREKHIERLRDIFSDARYDESQKLNYFRRNVNEQHYISALEIELNLDLEPLIRER